MCQFSEIEQGSWENGLSYECRTVLFKAFHNLIERNLLNKGFARFGKWFIFPTSPSTTSTTSASSTTGKKAGSTSGGGHSAASNSGCAPPPESTFPLPPGVHSQLSFSFEFFVHGDSTVCASVDVRQHPPVYRLTKNLILLAQTSGLPVILSPYGLAGTLTGQAVKESDPTVQKIMADWKRYYPLNSFNVSTSSSTKSTSSSRQESSFKFEDSSLSSDSSSSSDFKFCPPIVEVAVAGVRMKYPSSYIFHVPDSSSKSAVNGRKSVTSTSSSSSTCQVNTSSLLTATKDANHSSFNYSSIPGRQSLDALLTPPNSPPSLDTPTKIKTPVMSCQQPTKASTCFMVRNATEQDVTLVKHPPPPTASASEGDSSCHHEGHLDFVDPSNKVACNCSRCKSPNKNKNSLSKDQKLANGTSVNGPSSKKDKMSTQGSSNSSNANNNANKSRHQQPFHKRNQPIQSWAQESDATSKTSHLNQTQPNSSSGQQQPFLAHPQPQPKTPVQISHKSPGFGGLPSIQSNATTPGAVESPRSAAPSSVANGDGPASVGGLSSLPSVSPHPAKDANSDFPDSSTSFTPLSQGPQSVSGPREKSQLEQLLSPCPSSNKSTLPFGSDGHSNLLWSSLAMGTPTSQCDVAQSTVESSTNNDDLRRSTLSKTLLYDFSCLSPDMESWDLPQPKRRRALPRQTEAIAGSDFKDSRGNVRLRDPYEFSDIDGDAHGDGVPSNDKFGKVDSTSLSISDKNSSTLSSLLTNMGRDTSVQTSLHLSGIIDSTSASSPMTPQFTRLEELKASYHDLDQIFEETSGDESSDGNSLSSNRIRSTSNYSSRSNVPSGPELHQMFPTPPSLEPNAASPSTTALLADILAENGDAPCSPAFLEKIRESKDVYKPQTICKIISPNKYAPITDLPPLPILPPECRYRPRTSAPNLPPSNNTTLEAVAPSPRQTIKSAGTAKSPIGYHHQQPSPLPPHSLLNRTLQAPPSSFGRSQPSLNLNIRSPGSFTPPVAISSPLQGALTGALHPLMCPPRSMSPFGSTGPRPGLPGHMVDSRSLHQVTSSIESSVDPALRPAVEISGLIVNLALSDSILNLHKDHNFESCTLCVCNMNIKGSDAGLYLPETVMPGVDELQYKCTCGFSAVVNRKKSQYAGLFYEDEVEVTGVPYEPLELFRKSQGMLESFSVNGLLGQLTQGEINSSISLLLDVLRTQCQYTLPSSSFLAKTLFTELVMSRRVTDHLRGRNQEMSLFRSDSCEVALMVLSAGKSILEFFPKVIQNVQNSEARKAVKKNILHEWLFMDPDVSSNNHDVVRFLRNLQPILQESVQKKPKRSAMWETTYNVSGPLTWRQFHRLAGRGTEDQCEPQPIPSLLVGYNKEWVGVAPYALKVWDQLSLEPYSTSRDIAYLVVSPENPYILPRVKTFFKELSTTYEVLRLGRHLPLSKIVQEGIIRAGKRSSEKLSDERVDEWFTSLSDPILSSKLKTYAQVCTAYLVNLIRDQAKNNFSEFYSSTSNKPSHNRPQPTGASPGASTASGSSLTPGGNSVISGYMSESIANDHSRPSHDDGYAEGGNSSMNNAAASGAEDIDSDDMHRQPAIMVYIVEPFSFATLDRESYKTACTGLLRCFAEVCKVLPDLQPHLNLQVISIESILASGHDALECTRQEQLRSLALSVFGQCRKTVSPVPLCKSLTGFGPAASLDHFLKKVKERQDSFPPHNNRFFCPPYILAPLKDKQTELGEMFGERREKSQTLYCSYCLTEDQRFLLTSVSNERGDVLENSAIHIDIPNRTRRRGASVRKFALNKLMEFLISVMAESTQPWRLVIGRLGRLGHGELREWASLLSKKALLKATARLKERCEQCNTLNYFDMPSILSACLISLEPDSNLRVFPDQFTSEDRFSANSCQLSTPQEASSTHLLIFPTSATTQSSQGNFQNDPGNLGDDDLLVALGVNTDGDDMGGDDLDGIWNWNDDLPSPGLQGNEQPGMSRSDSPGGRQAGFDGKGGKVCLCHVNFDVQLFTISYAQ